MTTPHSLLPTPYSLLPTHHSLLTTPYSPLTPHHSPLTPHHSPNGGKVLLAAGASASTLTANGHSPLHAAASLGSVPLVDVLLEARADVHARTNVS